MYDPFMNVNAKCRNSAVKKIYLVAPQIHCMQEEFHRWYSPNLEREMEMLVFGTAGIPVLLFPTSMGKYYEAKDRHLIQAASWFIEQGKMKIYCPDSYDSFSWYNKQAHPGERAWNHHRYDTMLKEEIVPRMQHETGHHRIIAAGCSFGGYHALNFGFRHPYIVSYIFSMSGVFNIKGRLDGYFDDHVYFNNPVDFVPDANHPDIWRLGIVLGTGENDICRPYNEEMSNILLKKRVNHWLDIRPEAVHDWPLWLNMFPHYLSLVK